MASPWRKPLAPVHEAPRDSVLVVEDDRALREELGASLKEAGFSVELAADADQAIRHLLAGFQPAVVLTDLFMPLASGSDLIDFLQADVRWADVALLGMTGNPSSVLAEALAETGVRLLAKPFDFSQLLLDIYTCEKVAALAPAT